MSQSGNDEEEAEYVEAVSKLADNQTVVNLYVSNYSDFCFSMFLWQ